MRPEEHFRRSRLSGFRRDVARGMAGAPTVRVFLLVAGAVVGLAVPDTDLALMALLHHRSALTHSLFPVLVVVAFARGRQWARAGAAGLAVGLAVHLACDALSPMVGFGRIWWPWPLKVPLGAGASRLWLVAHALGGYALAVVWSRRALPGASALVLSVAVVTGALYGALSERSLLAVMVATVVPVALLLLVPREGTGDAG